MADCEDVDLLPSIRQLISKIEPALQSADSLEAAEELVLHLEATDENFHRYEYVKYIRQRMDEVLGPLIEDQMEKQTHKLHTKGSEEDFVRVVTEHVVNDPTYFDMVENLKQQTKDSVARLLLTFDGDHSEHPMKTTHSIRNSPKRCSFEFSEGSSSSFDSSFNQGFMFMKQEHFVAISENLEPLKSLKTRQDAITKLCQIPPSDVMACDQWENLRAGLINALGDSDQHMEEKSLQFHAKMFSAKSHTISKEVYTSLVEYLCNQFTTRKSKSMYLKDGLDLNNSSIKRLLRKFRLLNEFQIEVPTYWVRFPENFVEDILEKTVKLIDVSAQNPLSSMEIVCPIHCIALLDPKARWFKKWMHGHYSRTFVLKSLSVNRELVENALQQCLDFISKSETQVNPISSLTETFEKQTIGDIYSNVYSEKDLKFVHFVHSLSLIGQVLMYVEGRKSFPVNSKYGPVNIQTLMVSLVTLLADSSPARSSKNKSINKLNPAVLVTNTFKMLCSSKEACHTCFCTDVFLGHLIKPVLEWLHDDPNDELPNEATLLHIADILAAIASWEAGRHIILYGETGQKFKENRSAAVHIIAEFSRRALNGDFSNTFDVGPSRAVAGAYLYLCRQLYNTCEGRLALHPYELHTIIADAWREVAREFEEATPTPGADGSNAVNSASDDTVAWANTLIDNLLNFAGTPKGLLCLQQTGTMNECVTYMYTRYAKKLQVSKTEKFGYGTMVTQVAATAPGMAALKSSGFIKRIVNELWTVLECGRDDRPVLRPSPTPVDPIDRMAHKSFTSIVNLLSAFPAVYEVIADQPLKQRQNYTFREMPDTIVDIIERLILVDSETKLHSLFNVEQSHTFGLRLLSIMVCSLDTLLLLESQYSIWNTLLKAQQDNKSENGDIIIDMLSVERNQILVRSYTIGGPSERVLPPKILDIGSQHPYPWPLFSSFPVPRDYTLFSCRPPGVKQENELTQLINGLRPSNLNAEWLSKCREAFYNVMTSKPDHISRRVIPELLDSIVAAMITTGEDKIFPIKPCTINDLALNTQSLSPLQSKGVKLSIRYGMYLRLLTNHDEALENLSTLLKKCQHYLRMQQRSLDSDLRFLQRDYVGFDWFVSSVFLIMAGNKDKAWNFLYHFSTLVSSGFLWIPRLYASVHLPVEQTISGIHPIFSCTGHNIELILQQEVSHTYSAFKMSGYTPSQICQHWLTQSFWNYLDWQQICHYILVCLLLGVDYQVYVCIAILRFMEPCILQHRQQQNLQVFLKEESIVGFKVGEHLGYMKSLEKKYRATILPDMVNLAKQ